MPKIVDHEYRKKEIAEATWRVILTQGMEGVSVRNIAREAGLSLGALRHYFSSQDELLLYTMNLVKERATARIVEIANSDLPPKEKVLQICLELIPATETTRAEMEVWFAFTFYLRQKREWYHAHFDGVYNGIQMIMKYMEQNRLLRDGLELEVETEKLYALIDGLAIHALLDPDRLQKENILAVLTNYLNRLWK